jgi:HAD superfamily hydrolase (TIGR01509 family)
VSGELSLSGIRLASWDVDGTLYRPLAVRWEIGRRLLAAGLSGGAGRSWRGLVAFRAARARLARLRRAPLPDESGLPDRGDGRDGARAAFEQDFVLPALAAIGPRPGAGEVLALLAERGLRQVVFSDYVAGDKLRALGLSAHFSAVYAGELAGAPKPSPVMFRRMARDFGVTPEQVLHIGDRPDTDGIAAAAFGCRVWILGRDFQDFRSLARWLRAGSTCPSGWGKGAGT